MYCTLTVTHSHSHTHTPSVVHFRSRRPCRCLRTLMRQRLQGMMCSRMHACTHAQQHLPYASACLYHSLPLSPSLPFSAHLFPLSPFLCPVCPLPLSSFLSLMRSVPWPRHSWHGGGSTAVHHALLLHSSHDEDKESRYVDIYIYIYVYVYVYVYIFIYIYIWIGTSISLSLYIYIYIYQLI